MAIITSANAKKCATCQQYQGNRQTDTAKRNVRYDARDTAICRIKRETVNAGATGCPKWIKWSELK